MRNKYRLGLILAILFQFLILTGMYVNAGIPLWTGNEIKIKTIPVDPRSMFRGNYVRLRYEFTEIESLHFQKQDLRNGEKVYVILKPDVDDIYGFSSVSLGKPDSGIYLRCRINNNHFWSNNSKHYKLKCGIEAFFLPKEKALAVEKNLRNSGIALLMVTSDGSARIKNIVDR